MTTIASRLQAVRSRITSLAAGRAVQLVAVSKTQPATALREAYLAGQRAFGESYIQEALDKMRELADLEIEWHFIGPIQSNKTRLIAENFAWVHGIDREKIALRLSDSRPENLPPLQVCIQVNLSGEASKSGVDMGSALQLARYVAKLGRIELRGLMAIPEPTVDEQLQRRRFAQLREIREAIIRDGIELDTLSMGMSQDMEAAISEGATIVRVGSAIFGSRKGSTKS